MSLDTLGIDDDPSELGFSGTTSNQPVGTGDSRLALGRGLRESLETNSLGSSIPKRRYNPTDRMFPRRVTALRAGVKDKTRVNVYMGGRFAFSLALAQIVDNGIKIGLELSEEDEARLRVESEFGKAYQRSLEWVLTRPHSEKELSDYLYKKTKPGVRTGKDQLGNYVMREYEGISPVVAERVKDKMLEKGYVNDEKFARWFVENRRVRKGASHKRLLLELHKKGIKRDLAERVMGELEEDGLGRDEKIEMMKVIEKKRTKYNDSDLVRYLVRQGFRYSDAREAVSDARAAGDSDLA